MGVKLGLSHYGWNRVTLLTELSRLVRKKKQKGKEEKKTEKENK
jgi:hypothetical protein